MSTRISRFFQRSLYDQGNQLRRQWFRLKTRMFYSWVFGSVGPRSIIFKPTLIARPEHIFLGGNVLIQPGARLEIVQSSPTRIPRLEIQDNSNLEQNCHVVCHNRIIIGRNVAIAANCCIVDVTHPFGEMDGNTRFADRILDDDAEVVIGDGSFIGFGCAVLPGVHIGRNVVVGANSVVTSDLPDCCIAAGSPARVRRRFDAATKSWIKAEPDPERS